MLNQDNVKMIRDALDIMNLPILVSLNDLKSRYRDLATKYHPDITNTSRIKW